MAGIRRNFLYNSILTTANYIFPLLLFPYVSRVLGVENNGRCNFVDSIINYFILFSTMGVAVLGIREVAACRDDSKRLNDVFSNLFTLTFITTVIGAVLLVAVIYIVPYLSSYRPLLYMGLLKLFFNVFLIEWFFKGLEEFRYITIRGIVVRAIYVCFVFVLVHSATDYMLYYLLTVMAVVVNACINCCYSRKYVHFSFRNLSLRRYLYPFLVLGAYLFLTSMYTSFNITFLGFVSGDVEVGYYSMAAKLFAIILALFSAFTGVMLPRISALIEKGKTDEFITMLYKSVDVLLSFSVPLAIFTFIMARPIVHFIAGGEYEGAVLPLRIVSVLFFVIGYEQILVMQALMPMREDKVILKNSLLGALCGVMLNLLLVPKLESVGSAYCWLFSEVLILWLSQHALLQKTDFSFPWRRFVSVCIGHLLLVPLLYAILYFSWNNMFVQLILGGSVMVVYVLIVQLAFLKNSELLFLLSKITRRKKL